MRRFIFNTQGTGISHEQIRRLENTQPGSGTYLESDMSGHPLGDEIMLLDGLEDAMHDMESLEALGYVGAGNYRSRAGEMDGFAVSLPRDRRAEREFAPWGLGRVVTPTDRGGARRATAIELRRPSQLPNRAKMDLRPLRPGSGGGRSHPGGRRMRRDFGPWGLGQAPDTEAEVSPYTVAKLNRPDLFIGPRFYPLEDLPTPNVRRAGRDFEPWGLGVAPVEYRDTPPPQSFFQGYEMDGTVLMSLGDEGYERWADTPSPGEWFSGFGDAAADRRAALATASSIRNACRSACGLIQERNAEETTRAQTRCRAGCDAAYSSAEAAINASLPPGTSGPSTAEQQAIIQAKLDRLAQAQSQAEAGQVPTPEDEGMSTNTMFLIGAGVLGVGLIAVLALRK